MVLAARWPATEGLSGDLTPLSIAAAVSTVPEKDLPGASGLGFRRIGEADPATPAVRVRSGLVTTLDDEGQPLGREAGGFPPTED
ncbi:hypothetical protein Franean1_5015 [Parafrankia sp. EAN1pec]|uniref:hypothetical protein n=1 Tax=Parafrankia sp. (strain EAN1pec) TaxID=298653 RepID=UPI000054400D|nr:hypothetical protein Franean1_5015 [Frankia sp. EAN1pec]